MVSLRLFGGVSLTGEDAPEVRRVLQQPKRLAVLAYLASTPGFVRRDHLVGLFWPEYDQDRARAALRKAVHDLRQALGGALATRGREELTVREDLLQCDVRMFERAVESGDDVGALALYRGDLLEGFFLSGAPEFERWLEDTRMRLRRQAAGSASRLADGAGEDHGNAIHWAKRALALAPDDEAALRRVLAALDRAGDRAGAVAVFEQYAGRLSSDFEVEPSPETLALIAAIRTRISSVPVRGNPPTDANVTEREWEDASAPIRESDRSDHASPSHNLDAIEWCARGQHHFFQLTEAGFAEAEICLRQSLDRNPGYAPALSALAGVTAYRFELNRDPQALDQAIGLAREALAIDPGLADAHLWLGYAHERKHEYQEAEDHCRAAVRMAPDVFLPHLFLGTALLCRGLGERRWELVVESVGRFARGIELEAMETAGYLHLGWLYLFNGQYQAARPLLERGAALEERKRGRVRLTGALVLQGLLQCRQREYKPAQSSFDRALFLYPQSAAIHAPLFTSLACSGQGEVALQRGAYPEAVDWYDRALEETANDPSRVGIGYARVRALCGRGIALHKMLRQQEAQNDLELAEELLADPAAVDGQWTLEACSTLASVDLARVHAATGDRDRMLALLTHALADGWGDLVQLDADVFFSPYAAHPALEELRATRRMRGELPAPLLVPSPPRGH